MFPGAGIAESTITDNVRIGEAPHSLFAVTRMVPLLALGTGVDEFVVDVSTQPEGKVQV